MVRLLFRFIGLLLLAGAFAALVVDGTRSVAAGAMAILPFGPTISAVSPNALPQVQKLVEAHAPKLWNPVLTSVFQAPTWVVLGVVGLILFALTRRRPPKIGYSRR